jgi:hypothetical protein
MTPRTKRALFTILGEQRRFVYLAVTLLSAAGVWAATRLPSAIYPELEFSRVTIVVQGTSLGARQVLFSITRPIEEAVSIVPGVTRVQSRAIRGGSETNGGLEVRTAEVRLVGVLRLHPDPLGPRHRVPLHRVGSCAPFLDRLQTVADSPVPQTAGQQCRLPAAEHADQVGRDGGKCRLARAGTEIDEGAPARSRASLVQ